METTGKYPPNRIRVLRESKDWTIRELAHRAGFNDHQTVSNLELQKAELKLSHMKMLAAAFGCRVIDIIEDPVDTVTTQDDAEREVLEQFRGLDDSAKQMLLYGLKASRAATDKPPVEPTDAGTPKRKTQD